MHNAMACSGHAPPPHHRWLLPGLGAEDVFANEVLLGQQGRLDLGALGYVQAKSGRAGKE